MLLHPAGDPSLHHPLRALGLSEQIKLGLKLLAIPQFIQETESNLPVNLSSKLNFGDCCARDRYKASGMIV